MQTNNSTRGTFTLRRLFPMLSERQQADLGEHSSVIRLRKGQNLFIAGDSPRAIYAVANGCIKIVREGAEGESILTRIVRSGQFLGIREVFGDFNYSRTAVALRDCEVFSINAESIKQLIHQAPDISFQFMAVFCNELARLEKRIESDIYRPAKTRVASVIYELYTIFADDGEHTFEPPLSRRDIADLADVTPETVSRALAELKSMNLVITQGTKITLLDPQSLQLEVEE